MFHRASGNSFWSPFRCTALPRVFCLWCVRTSDDARWLVSIVHQFVIIPAWQQSVSEQFWVEVEHNLSTKSLLASGSKYCMSINNLQVPENRFSKKKKLIDLGFERHFSSIQMFKCSWISVSSVLFSSSMLLWLSCTCDSPSDLVLVLRILRNKFLWS